MAHSRNLGSGRPRVGTLVLGAALAFAALPASAKDARSSPEDRRRFVAVAHQLEEAPLSDSLKGGRAWAVTWLADAPDIDVTLCADFLPGVVESKYRYSSEIVAQDALSMAAFVIEHPEAAHDPAAQQLAGVEGALKAYRAVLKDRPDARSPGLDALLQTQSQGALPAFARKAWTSCSAQKSTELSLH